MLPDWFWLKLFVLLEAVARGEVSLFVQSRAVFVLVLTLNNKMFAVHSLRLCFFRCLGLKEAESPWVTQETLCSFLLKVHLL